MGIILKLLAGLILAVLAMGAALHYLHVPYDRYFPPPTLYVNATAKGDGVATGVEELPYMSHWWASTDDELYLDYSFPTVQKILKPNGQTAITFGPTYSGMVRITEGDREKWESQIKDMGKVPIEVFYDPNNPVINYVPGTLGVYNRSAGIMGTWLLYVLGLAALTWIFYELIRRIRPGDL
jgi:hypothetical protein